MTCAVCPKFPHNPLLTSHASRVIIPDDASLRTPTRAIMRAVNGFTQLDTPNAPKWAAHTSTRSQHPRPSTSPVFMTTDETSPETLIYNTTAKRGFLLEKSRCLPSNPMFRRSPGLFDASPSCQLFDRLILFMCRLEPSHLYLVLFVHVIRPTPCLIFTQYAQASV
jgi:hypothetical protein